MLLRLIEDVEHAIDHECYFAALSLALTLPDICGKAEYPEEGNGARYKAWCRKFVCVEHPRGNPYSGDMPCLNEDIIYSLRNLFLHQGTPNIKPTGSWDDRCQVDHFRLKITDPDTPDGELSMVSYGAGMKIIQREITVGVRDLCYRLRVAAKEYYEENPDKFTFFDFDFEDCRKKNNLFYNWQEGT